jgi:AcrR family transcriptional regulator
MPRAAPGQRLSDLSKAATEEFGRLGYRGTKTAAVSAKAGMSSGALFTYVESKEALFHLVFLYGFEMTSERLPDLPVRTPAPGESLGVIRAGLSEVQMPRIRSALAGSAPIDIAEELSGILEERYDLLNRFWPVIAVIERCAVEMPELEAAWFDLARAGTYEELGTYLERRMAEGLLRTMPDVTVAAKMVTESLAWFAWHRREGRDATLYDDAAVRRTVVEFICAALVPESLRRTSAGP